MKIDAIKNGIVIDHIPAGCGMRLYELLDLAALDAPMALIQRAASAKLGKKDIIKIAANVPLNEDVIGYVAPHATVNVIHEGDLVEKRAVELPATLTNVLFCHNPRCITSCEQELPHVFQLTDGARRIYRCRYCEAKA